MSTPQPSRIPAIAGVAQIVQRPGDRPLTDARGAIELMVDAVRAAGEDAGVPALVERAQLVASVGGWFHYKNPGQLVAEQLGIPDAHTMFSGISGTTPQDMVGIAAQRVAAGEIDVALVIGGEARWSHARMKRDDIEPTWISDPGDREPEMIAAFAPEMITEMRAFGGAPAPYAVFEDRLRVSAGRTIEEQRDHIAALWAHFSEVAAQNPYAWDRRPHTAEEIRTATPDNRMIAFPYTKAMVANNTVDMATAIIVCSAEVAASAGVSSDRLVFPQVVTNAHETWLVAARRELDQSPALAGAARRAFSHTGLGIDDIEHIDLYACFPSMVQLSAGALGIGPDRPLTITGGLGFAAAPIGNSVGHSICAMVERVRDGGLGLVHGNGGSATKQSFAIYSTRPAEAFAKIDVQDEVDLEPREVLAEDWSGSVTVEAATVLFDREGPSHVLAAVLDGSGARGWAQCRDTGAIETAMTEGLVGSTGVRDASGGLSL
ncbi:MAG: hypothetical protein R2715_18200 [Ilumatobacteraceae bacterium]